jgi:hypothetical protein
MVALLIGIAELEEDNAEEDNAAEERIWTDGSNDLMVGSVTRMMKSAIFGD